MSELVITVRGMPAPQGSKDIFRGRPVESSKLVKPWRKSVADAVLVHRANRHLAGPLAVDAVFYLPRPKGHYGTGRNASALRGDAPDYPVARGRGDVDKYSRGLLDALQLAGVMDDDGQVADLTARKRYAELGTLPGALVRVRALGEGGR
jgi:crossover junction endodeoxyribonuclease RusA